MQDGIHGMVPREKMAPAVQKYWDFVNCKPDAPVYLTEFGYYSMDKWIREEGLRDETELHALCRFDAPAVATLGGYMPTCDHGVPEEVKLEDYIYLRKRLEEFG